MHQKYKLKYEEAVEYINTLITEKNEENSFIPKLSNDIMINEDLNKRTHSAYPFDNNGDIYFLSDSKNLRALKGNRWSSNLIPGKYFAFLDFRKNLKNNNFSLRFLQI